MNAVIEKLKQKSFLVIGRAGMDFYAEPPGTEMEQAESFSAHVGGSAANTAVALARLGCTTEVVTCVSDDAVGRFVSAKLASFGVGTKHFRSIGGEARNSLAVVETRLDNCQSVIYRNGAADFDMGIEDIEAPDYESAGGVILSGTALAAEPSRSAIFQAIELSRAAGTPVIIDMDYRPYSWPSQEEAAAVYTRAIERCDLVIGNDVEFNVAAGPGRDGFEHARSLIDGTPALVIYKMGERGSVTFAGSESFETGIFPVQAIKPTGAGDAFMGGFLSGLANGLSVRGAVEQGSASAAIVVTKVACSSAMPDRVELDSFIANHSLSSTDDTPALNTTAPGAPNAYRAV
ncbi:5-dehydro-2-deoxygluconokinase [Pelagibius sp. Alg239-R121]|uniref:5-dehydro-2-deoxygluconokinase n=1 Tax=Pelagibius sp. Alg239-R121 TaxID=2993448 RepID=UPI0024A6FCB9|nr:5-dehydro-2-deoxygluconokinase [Pelagibius sp. Alg239-R121]